MQILQNSCILHITKQESYKLLCTYFSAQNYMYDIYLHICRLVLNAYKFNMLTAFYIKSYVSLYQIVQPFQDHCFELIDPSNF